MSDDPKNKQNLRRDAARSENDEELSEEERLLRRFPAAPSVAHDVPAPPKIVVNLPPHPDAPKPGRVEPGAYRNTALASQAASSFIMPIVILMLAGWLIDNRFHTGGIAIVIALILGFAVGVANLLRVINKMNDDPKP